MGEFTLFTLFVGDPFLNLLGCRPVLGTTSGWLGHFLAERTPSKRYNQEMLTTNFENCTTKTLDIKCLDLKTNDDHGCTNQTLLMKSINWRLLHLQDGSPAFK